VCLEADISLQSPMDFSIISDKVGQYASKEAFRDDMLRVFSNAELCVARAAWLIIRPH
jgi:hypothetical protein